MVKFSQGMNSRRCSDITCSTDSYLERRCSAITIGITSLPPISSRNPSRRQSRETASELFPNIQVIQPTPKTSPCPSEGNLYDRSRKTRSKSYEPSDSFDYISEYPDEYHEEIYNRRKSKIEDSTFTSDRPPPLRRAPLASLSSFKISSADYQDSDLRSLGSDSVFAESIYADTDDDMEQFSTDSDEISNNDPQSPRLSSNRSHSTGSKLTQIEHPPRIVEQSDEDNDQDDDDIVSSSIGAIGGVIDSSNHKSSSLGKTFETKAIIERHETNSLNSASDTINIESSFVIVEADNDDYDDCESKNDDHEQQSSTSTISCSPIKTLSSEVVIIEPVPKNAARNNSTTSTSSITNNKNTSSSNKIISNNSNKTSECDKIDVSFIDSNRQQQQQQATSPSVILELPVLSVSNSDVDLGVASSISLQSPTISHSHAQYHNQQQLSQNSSSATQSLQHCQSDDNSTIDIDPSVPGPSRKWSKETLF